MISVATLDSGFSMSSKVGNSPNTPFSIRKNNKTAKTIPAASPPQRIFLKRFKRASDPLFFFPFLCLSIVCYWISDICILIPTLLTPCNSTLRIPCRTEKP